MIIANLINEKPRGGLQPQPEAKSRDGYRSYESIFSTPIADGQSNIVPLSVYREHCYAAAHHSLESIHAIRDAGIKWDEAVAHAGCVKYLYAVPDGASFFPADDGEPWFVFEALDNERITIDLVGWPVARPGEFRSVEGIIGLGIAQVTNPATYFCDQPLYVYRTPLGWLQNGCNGCVVLDREEAPGWLAWALGNICGEDIEHAREIARMLHGYIDRKRILAPVTNRQRAA